MLPTPSRSQQPIQARLALMLTGLLVLSACGATTSEVPSGSTAPTANTVAALPTAETADALPTADTADQPTAAPDVAAQPTSAIVETSGEGCAPSATKITWFVGLGIGGDAPTIPLEKAWVENFNKSQTDACVLLQIVSSGGNDALRAQLAAGTVPDIVGPVGGTGRSAFKGAWADLTPLAQEAGFDLTAYDPELLNLLKDQEVLVGFPFGLYPSFLFYNKDLFDEARLPYPPRRVGEQYDGKEWNNETFTELAKILTVDANGSDATSADFDPENIQQYGFFQQFTSAAGIGNRFGAAALYDPQNPTAARIPETWRTAWTWYYDGVWNGHFMPNADAQKSDILGAGNGFASGNIAMAHTHLWYTCCFETNKLNWDIAVLPSVNGKVTANMHGDTFAILEQSKNKAVAFKVLATMAQDKELFKIYNVLPANPADRATIFAELDKKVAPNKVDWSVVEEMAKYPDVPNHEAWIPNVAKSNDALTKFLALMNQTPGLNIDQEIDKLQAELDALYKEPGAIPTTP